MRDFAVVTISIGYLDYTQFTIPLMKRYAEKIGADFIILDGSEGYTSPKAEKFKLAKLLETYSRVIYFDSDILVRPDTPSLFSLVNEEEFGIVAEADEICGDRREPFRKACATYCPESLGKEIERPWFNSGLMVASQKHKDLFKQPKKPLTNIAGWLDMPYFNAMATKHDYKLHDLGIKFNYMGSLIFSKNPPIPLRSANIIHITSYQPHYRKRFARLMCSLWATGNPLKKTWLSLKLKAFIKLVPLLKHYHFLKAKILKIELMALRTFLKAGDFHLNELHPIAKQIKAIPKCKLLVFGCGDDSILWETLNANGETVFIEDNAALKKQTESKLKRSKITLVKYRTKLSDFAKRIEIDLFLELPTDISQRKWDVILVDGPASHPEFRAEFGYEPPGRMQSIYTAKKLCAPGGYVFVHDCHREIEQKCSDEFLGEQNVFIIAKGESILKGFRI